MIHTALLKCCRPTHVPSGSYTVILKLPVLIRRCLVACPASTHSLRTKGLLGLPCLQLGGPSLSSVAPGSAPCQHAHHLDTLLSASEGLERADVQCKLRACCACAAGGLPLAHLPSPLICPLPLRHPAALRLREPWGDPVQAQGLLRMRWLRLAPRSSPLALVLPHSHTLLPSKSES